MNYFFFNMNAELQQGSTDSFDENTLFVVMI